METHFLASGNHFVPQSQIFFKEFFIPASENTFFSLEEKVLFLLFLPAVETIIWITEAYLKLLLLLLVRTVFDFSDIPAKAVFHVFLNKFSIAASGNRLCVNLKQYSII